MKKILIILLVISSSVFSISSLKVPTLTGRVNDYANLLSSSDRNRLESDIKGLESGTSSQIAVLIIQSLEGDNLEDFSIRTVEEWQLGTNDNDNGVLLLISLDDRSIRLEVGYGLEGTLTDAKSDYIIRNVIAPSFKKGNIYTGLSEGVKAISGTISGEYVVSNKTLTDSRESRSTGRPSFSFIFIILFVILSGLGRRGGKGRRGGGLASILILNSLLGGSSRGSGGFGGSSGGGFGGGGFSGGGGGFGGGGASGGW